MHRRVARCEGARNVSEICYVSSIHVNSLEYNVSTINYIKFRPPYISRYMCQDVSKYTEHTKFGKNNNIAN